MIDGVQYTAVTDTGKSNMAVKQAFIHDALNMNNNPFHNYVN